jgi:hypothetical protein
VSRRISSKELQNGSDLRLISRIYDSAISAIRRQLFGPQAEMFAEIERDPHVQGIADEPKSVAELRPRQRFDQIRRLVSGEDTHWVVRRLPDLRSTFAANRRFLLSQYAAELSRDIDVLWVAKRAQAETHSRDVESLAMWRIEMKLLVYTLHLLALLAGRARLSGRIVATLEAAIASTIREVSDLLPDAEILP